MPFRILMFDDFLSGGLTVRWACMFVCPPFLFVKMEVSGSCAAVVTESGEFSSAAAEWRD